jgi:hypothetical protein
MPAPDHLLTTDEMAQFVADGFLRFEALVPQAINAAVIDELRALEGPKLMQALGQPPGDETIPRPDSLTPLSECYPAPSVLGEYLRLPQVQGVIQSLVGSDPLYDHDFVHHLPAGSGYRQNLHVDAVIDSADPTFDIQLFYFPHEVVAGEGGTRFVPGSHLRRVRAEGVSRYQRLLGEEQYHGPAGTLLVFHHGMWHAGQPNPGATDRWMHKIRLNPVESQVRRFNLDDFEERHNGPSDHVFATTRPGTVAERLRKMHPWQQGHEARYELMQRARLWRYLSGDAGFDVDYYHTRLEGRAKLANG